VGLGADLLALLLGAALALGLVHKDASAASCTRGAAVAQVRR
jgi:hypothetical protein